MVSNPFIPRKRANLLIIDGSLPGEILKNLQQYDLKIIPTIRCEQVPKPIAYHPDIVMHPVNHNTLVIAPNVFEYYEEKLYGLGIKIIRGQTELGKNYPEHIAYNVGRLGNLAIHHSRYTDEVLKILLKKEGLEFIHVNQGYTKCSMMIVDTKACITADRLIYQKLKTDGMDILLIEPGYIRLDGYPYGFIGGASGHLSRDDILLSGNIKTHPDMDRILMFFKKYNKNIIYLSDKKIVDIGTIISLYSQ